MRRVVFLVPFHFIAIIVELAHRSVVIITIALCVKPLCRQRLRFPNCQTYDLGPPIQHTLPVQAQAILGGIAETDWAEAEVGDTIGRKLILFFSVPRKFP